MNTVLGTSWSSQLKKSVPHLLWKGGPDDLHRSPPTSSILFPIYLCKISSKCIKLCPIGDVPACSKTAVFSKGNK